MRPIPVYKVCLLLNYEVHNGDRLRTSKPSYGTCSQDGGYVANLHLLKTMCKPVFRGYCRLKAVRR